MSLWQWLVTPQGIPILVAFVGILSGLIGGGVSQLIAGMFKTHGDTRQINAAAEVAKAAEIRWQREQEFERKRLSFDRLRDVSVRIVQAHAEQASQYDSIHYDIGEFSGPAFAAAKSARYVAEVELGLMVPSAKPAIDAARKALWLLDETEEQERMSMKSWDNAYEKYEKALAHLEDAIREVLALDENLIHNQPQLNEAPASGKTIDTGKTSTNPA